MINMINKRSIVYHGKKNKSPGNITMTIKIFDVPHGKIKDSRGLFGQKKLS